MLAELVEQDHRQKIGAAQPRGMAWKGSGAWLIFSQSRQVSFSRTVWITFRWRRRQV